MFDRAKHDDSSARHHSNDGRALHQKLHEECYQQHTPHTHANQSYNHAHGEHSSSSGQPDRTDHRHKLVDETAHKIEKTLKHDPHDYGHVFKEIENLWKHDQKHFGQDLRELNNKLHAQKLLPHLDLIQNDLIGKNGRTEHGFGLVSEDPSLKGLHHKSTMISTSHAKPHESNELAKAYHGMHYNHGKYNGFNDSVEGGGGAEGGFDKNAVGNHVPDGAKKELIAKALQLSGLQPTESNIAAVNKIVARESAWNPNVTNNWDSNAKAGHPSTGLMQTIPSTFHKFALPGYNSNIHDPLSNLIAGIRYAQSRYGHQRAGQSGVEFVASRPGGY